MPKKQKILCINDGQIFDSMSDAAKHYKIAQSAISRQVNGNRRMANGYYFMSIGNDFKKADIKRLQREYLQKMLLRGTNNDD